MGRSIVLFFGAIGLGVFLFSYPLAVLTLTKGDQVIFSKRVTPGDTFELAFLHSIALSDVRDRFLIDPEYRMVLIETWFQGQGTGLPSNVAQGEKLHREGDWFHITGMRRVVPSIPWRAQSEWRDRFRFGNEPEIDVSAQVGNGLVNIRVEKVRLIDWLGYYLTRQLKPIRNLSG
jgi:hypothetical protein